MRTYLSGRDGKAINVKGEDCKVGMANPFYAGDRTK
jgi:hypothetical protein